MSQLVTAALLELSRNVRVKQLDTLWRIERDYTFPPVERLRALVHGLTIHIPGELTILPNGAMTVHGPFGWDGPSPRLKLIWRGRVLLSLGSPLGPRMPGTKLRASCRGTLRHDRLCRSRVAIATALQIPVSQVIDVSDLCLQDDISEDWSPAWGTRFYKSVRSLGDTYRALS